MATSTKTAQFRTAITIGEDARRELVELLNESLATNFDLYSQTKQAHWNVKGIHFFELHKMFDEIAEMIEPYTDALAERATTLGGVAFGTVRMAGSSSILEEFPTEPYDGKAYLQALAARYAKYGGQLRDAAVRAEELGDLSTNDLFVEVSRAVDQGLYFIEAHLQGQ